MYKLKIGWLCFPRYVLLNLYRHFNIYIVFITNNTNSKNMADFFKTFYSHIHANIFNEGGNPQILM